MQLPPNEQVFIRRAFHVEGKAIRQIQRETGHRRQAIRRAISNKPSPPPLVPSSSFRSAPIFGPFQTRVMWNASIVARTTISNIVGGGMVGNVGAMSMTSAERLLPLLLLSRGVPTALTVFTGDQIAISNIVGGMAPHGVTRRILAAFSPQLHLLPPLDLIISIASIEGRITISGIAGGMVLVDGAMSMTWAAFSPRHRQRYPANLTISSVSIVVKTIRFGIVGGMVLGARSTNWEDSSPDTVSCG